MVTRSTNQTRLIDGIEALGIDDIRPGITIAAFSGTTWQTLEVVSAPYRLDPLDSWWATMTNRAPGSRNETLPRNLADLGIIQNRSGIWSPRRVVILATDLSQLEATRWSYDTPFLF